MLKFKLHLHEHAKKETQQEAGLKEQEMNEEVAAAIGLALHLHLRDQQDYEKTILTIQQVMRPYSPWSSKIYGINHAPFRIPRFK